MIKENGPSANCALRPSFRMSQVGYDIRRHAIRFHEATLFNFDHSQQLISGLF